MTEVMTTASSELVYQLAAIVVSTISAVVGSYLKSYLKTNKFVKEYDLYNSKVERVLDNAIMYAEAKAKKYAGEKVSKMDLAIKYIDIVSPDIIHKEGAKLELMIDRKVQQVINK